jgi:hypothetical protein
MKRKQFMPYQDPDFRFDSRAMLSYLAVEGMKLGMRADAGESAFFARELEEVRARSYDLKLIELKGRMLVPVDNSVPPGADAVTYSQYTSSGMAKLISSYAEDFPRADIFGKQFTVHPKSLGASYGYNIQEIRAAQMTGLPLEQRRANAARRAIEEKIDKMAQIGDADTDCTGLLNQSAAGTYVIPNGASGSQTWALKTPVEILADLNGIANSIVSTTVEVEHPDTIVLPIAQFLLISVTPWSPQNASNVTILEMFLKNNPWVSEVEPWYACKGAGSGSTDRMVCYKRDPDHIMLVIPQEFEQFPPQVKGMEFVVPCHARCAGVQVPYPLSIAYGDGI